jgi:UDP-N-acetyl-D-glucosamine dehydrogenase
MAPASPRMCSIRVHEDGGFHSAPVSPLRVLIIGQGYVGTALAIACLAAGYTVQGVDRADSRRKAIGDTLVANVMYSVCATPTGEFDIAVIAVQTSIAPDGTTNLEPVRTAAAVVGNRLRAGGIVINESTVGPGVTEDVIGAILRERSGLAAGDFDIAFSPERVDPGNTEWNFIATPKLVAGDSARALERAATFYRTLAATVVEVASIRDAEFAKLTENSFRAVSIALVNELAVVARSVGVDINSALAAAGTKPFGYMDFRPGPGVGGDCIPTDPAFLLEAARAVDPDALPILARALLTNESIPRRVVDRVLELVGPASAPSVLLVGLAHKKNVGDLTNAPSRAIARLLGETGVRVYAIDGLVDASQVPRSIAMIDEAEAALIDFDLVVVLTLHDGVTLDFASSAVLLDTTAGLAGSNVQRL